MPRKKHCCERDQCAAACDNNLAAGSNRRNAYSRFPNREAIITVMKRTLCICAVLPVLLLGACGGGSSPLVATGSPAPDYTAFANPTMVTIAGYSGDATIR